MHSDYDVKDGGCFLHAPDHPVLIKTSPKIFFVVKLMLVLQVTCLLACSTAFSQSVSLSVENEPFEKVIGLIRKQSGYAFFYDTQHLIMAKPVTLRVNNISVERLLPMIFNKQPFGYQIIDKTIILRPLQNNPAPRSAKPSGLQLEKTIQGMVSDSLGAALPGVSVLVKGTTTGTITGADGSFELQNITENATLRFSMIGFASQEITLKEAVSYLQVTLRETSLILGEATVVNTGFQQLPKERATGSFVQVDNELLNRRTGTDIISRLEGVTSGMLFNGNPVGAGVKSPITIRGASTIYANDKPLIVLDNFEYNGDISNINPNDIESITVLKDAAAASIWGAKSGNGVIVVTTRKGKLNQAPKVSFNSNLTIGDKPDLFYGRNLGAADFIEVEQFLFGKGYFDSFINSNSRPGLSPVVEILVKKRSGELSAEQASTQIESLKKQDIRDDFKKYFYRKSINQQYAIRLNGGSKNLRYYVSAGYDKNLSNLVGNDYSRFTVNANNSYSLLNNKLDLTTSIYYTQTKIQTKNNGPSSAGYSTKTFLYPYAQLADANGTSLSIAKLRQAYIDTAGGGKMLDWNYHPLDEIRLADNTANANNYLLSFDATYKLFKGLDFTIKYQYGRGSSQTKNLQSQQSYYTRNYINQFTGIDPKTGLVTRPVPLGGILDLSNTIQQNQNLRTQVNYNLQSERHALSAIAGYEIKEFNHDGSSSRFYGYDDSFATSANVDYLSLYPLYYGTSRQQISSGRSITSLTDRYRSYYANAAYTFVNRYTLSISARKDESNLFGVKANQKGVPLWSSGIKWDIDQEKFYHISWLDHLKLRATYGYNGNIDKNVTAYLTTSRITENQWGVPYALIKNPPNGSLRWEKIRMINFAADFGLINSRVTGSVEYYLKTGTNLMGDATLAPSTGLTQYRGNSANIKGNGIDITVSAKNLTGPLQWNTSLIFNHARTEVTHYLLTPATAGEYVIKGDISPIQGRALYAVYSYRWAGLNASGDPQGYLGENVSTDWSGIQNSKDHSSMVYNGPANPTTFGSLLNTFCWKAVSLSFNVIYKLGYYFKRPSLNYAQLLGMTSAGDKEFASRWQKPGDENNTTVPAMRYPTNLSRETFYQNTQIMVGKGDHIRFQDIRLSYDLDKATIPKLPVQKIRFYGYINNLGIIWRANKYGIDPDAAGLPNPKTFAVGLNAEF